MKINLEQGDDLGSGLRKIRMEISDKSHGKSGGARIIIQVKVIDKVVYVLSTYDKGEYGSIDTNALKRLLKNKPFR